MGQHTTYRGYQVILLKRQQCINDKKVPTGGLTFDADHAGALKAFPIIVTADGRLAGNLKSMCNIVSKFTGGVHDPIVVMNAKQLKAAIDKMRG